MKHNRISVYTTFYFVIVFMVASICLSCDPEVIVRYTLVTYDPHKVPCPLEAGYVYEPGNMTDGRVAGLKNCDPFLASASLTTIVDSFHFFILHIRTYEQIGDLDEQREFMQLTCRPSGEGTWGFSKKGSTSDVLNTYSTFTQTGTPDDDYILDESFIWNGITIHSLDTLTNRASGTFQCRFILDSTISSAFNPDTLLFTECHFEVRLQ